MTSRTQSSTYPDAVIAFVIGAFAFGFRYLDHHDFANEQFITLAQAQAWLAGDWPIRDYTEPGMVLTDGLSAAAQKLFGPTPLSELVLCAGAFAVAAAVTYWVTTRITGRRSLGVFAALLQIAANPVLFAYPKLLIYPVLLALGLAYARRQTRFRLALLAGWSAAAFLIRQDHGIYAFIAGVVLVVVVHHAEGRRVTLQRAGSFALAFLLFVTPFLAYAQAEMGLLSYLKLGVEMSRLEARRSVGSTPTFGGIERGPLLVRRPIQEDDLAYIHIQWSANVGDDRRRALEQRGQLLFGQLLEGRTWGYRVDRGALDALGSVINEPAVQDVDGIDRKTLRLSTHESPAQWVLRVTRLSRLEVGPPIMTLVSLRNCTAFLFYLCYLLPVFAVLLWWRAPSLARTNAGATRALLPALCVLAFVCAAGLLRIVIARLPDMFGTLPILLSWVIAVLLAVDQPRRRVFSRAVAFLLIGAVAVSVYRIGGEKWPLIRETTLHPLTAWSAAAETTRTSREWPWSAQWPGDDEWKLAVYIHDCTRADDRLLVTWQAPEFFYFSKRVFAGREGALLRLLRPTYTYEQQVLDTWQRQSVPIVLTNDETEADFAEGFPALAHHLATAYAVAGTTRWPGRPSITVHVDRNRVPVRKDPTFGLPCFT